MPLKFKKQTIIKTYQVIRKDSMIGIYQGHNHNKDNNCINKSFL